MPTDPASLSDRQRHGRRGRRNAHAPGPGGEVPGPAELNDIVFYGGVGRKD